MLRDMNEIISHGTGQRMEVQGYSQMEAFHLFQEVIAHVTVFSYKDR